MRMRGNDATTSKFMAGICVGIHRLRGTDRTTRTDRGQVMSAVSKFYEWEVWGNYGYGWDNLFTATSKREASSILRDYRINAPEGSYQVKTKRIKQGGDE
jgi:hypothetical protein